MVTTKMKKKNSARSSTSGKGHSILSLRRLARARGLRGFLKTFLNLAGPDLFTAVAVAALPPSLSLFLPLSVCLIAQPWRRI